MSKPFRILDPLLNGVAAHAQRSAFEGRCAFTVMAKAPVPGKVKTRLSPPLTPDQAAALNADFLRDTLASLGLAAAASGIADCVVSYTPVGQEEAFRGILPENTLLVPQRGDGFGERLLATATDLFRCGFSAVCLIDSDSPTVPTTEFATAARTLLPAGQAAAHAAVLGRSEDGGYYLLGLTQPHARLFEEIDWSTERVADQTEARATEVGVPVVRLATWYDVDDARSFARLHKEVSGDPSVPHGYDAPNTRAFLLALEAAAETAGTQRGRP